MHRRATLAQAVRQDVAGLGRPRDQDALAAHVGQRLEQALGHEALGHHVRAHPVPLELGGGAGTDGGDGGAGERPRVAAERVEVGADAVRAREADQVIGLRPGEQNGARLDPDRGRLEHLGAQLAQPRGEAAGLVAGARDRDDLAVQRTALEPGERVAERSDRADHGNGRRPKARLADAFGDLGERGGDRALARQSAAGDHGRRLLRVAPCRAEPLGDQREVADAHVEDERAGEAGQGVPVEHRLLLAGILVAGDEGDGGRSIAVCHGDARVGRRGHARRHARHDLEGDARGRQRLGLLAPAAEHEGVASLEAYDPAAGAAELHEQGVEVVLLHRRRARLLADVSELRLGARPFEGPRRDEAVVEDHVGRGDQLERAPRHEAGVARPGAHEIDHAAVHRGKATRRGTDPIVRIRHTGLSPQMRIGGDSSGQDRVPAARSASAKSSRAPASPSRRATSCPSAAGSAGVAVELIADPMRPVREADEGGQAKRKVLARRAVLAKRARRLREARCRRGAPRLRSGCYKSPPAR